MKMAGATISTVRLLKNDQPGVGAGVENVVHNSILVQVVPNIYRKDVKIVMVSPVLRIQDILGWIRIRIRASD